MIDHKYANSIQTGKELEAYFLEHLEVGDEIKVMGRKRTVIARHENSFWVIGEGDYVPLTAEVGSMDSIH
jgi:hypothetical protein